MTSGEASLLAKLEQIEHNQKKIMEGIIAIASQKTVFGDMANINKIYWEQLDQELKEHKKLKTQAKRNGVTVAQWKKKVECDK